MGAGLIHCWTCLEEPQGNTTDMETSEMERSPLMPRPSEASSWSYPILLHSRDLYLSATPHITTASVALSQQRAAPDKLSYLI